MIVQAPEYEDLSSGEVLPGRIITARRAQRIARNHHHLHARRGMSIPLYLSRPFQTTSFTYTAVADVGETAPPLTGQGGMMRLVRPVGFDASFVSLSVEGYLYNASLEVEIWRMPHLANDGMVTQYAEVLLHTMIIDQPQLAPRWAQGEHTIPYVDTFYTDQHSGRRVPLVYGLRLRLRRLATGQDGVLYQAHATDTWYDPSACPLLDSI